MADFDLVAFKYSHPGIRPGKVYIIDPNQKTT